MTELVVQSILLAITACIITGVIVGVACYKAGKRDGWRDCEKRYRGY